MDIDLSDLKHYRTYHRPALDGREFVLRVMTCKSGVVEFRNPLLVDAIKQGLSWRRRGVWAELLDFERKTLISKTRFAQLWSAALGGYGVPSKDHPYIVRGPTINPTFMEKYWTADLMKALDYAPYWQGSDEDPYWVEVRGPNDNIVLSRSVVENLYHAEVKARGGSITLSLVRTTGKCLVGPGVCIPQAEIVWEKRIV